MEICVTKCTTCLIAFSYKISSWHATPAHSTVLKLFIIWKHVSGKSTLILLYTELINVYELMHTDIWQYSPPDTSAKNIIDPSVVVFLESP